MEKSIKRAKWISCSAFLLSILELHSYLVLHFRHPLKVFECNFTFFLFLLMENKIFMQWYREISRSQFCFIFGIICKLHHAYNWLFRIFILVTYFLYKNINWIQNSLMPTMPRENDVIYKLALIVKF